MLIGPAGADRATDTERGLQSCCCNSANAAPAPATCPLPGGLFLLGPPAEVGGRGAGGQRRAARQPGGRQPGAARGRAARIPARARLRCAHGGASTCACHPPARATTLAGPALPALGPLCQVSGHSSSARRAMPPFPRPAPPPPHHTHTSLHHFQAGGDEHGRRRRRADAHRSYHRGPAGALDEPRAGGAGSGTHLAPGCAPGGGAAGSRLDAVTTVGQSCTMHACMQI